MGLDESQFFSEKDFIKVTHMKTGIKNLKEVLAFVLSLSEAMYKSMADGRIGLTDMVYFLEAFRKLSDAVDDIHIAVKEMMDIDEAEKAELIAYAKEEFDIPNDMIEEYVEKGIALGIQLMTFISMFFQKKNK